MEVKKSYSPFGSTPLSVDEVLPDIQTGRAVYPDKDKEADASYMERINQYKHEGFHDVSEDGGGSGGGSSSGGGTLVIRADHFDDETFITYYDKTWNEVNEALINGDHVTVVEQDPGVGQYRVYQTLPGSSKVPLWCVRYFVPGLDNPVLELEASSADGYLQTASGE